MKSMKKYLLSGYGFTAEIIPEWGADISYLKYGGEDILMPTPNKKELLNNPYLHGAPLLLPANRTVDGRFSFMGEEYTLPINEKSTNCHIHGFLYKQKFKVLESNQTQIVLEYVNKDEIYPFPFSVLVKYEVSEDGFMSNYDIKNLSNEKMPLTFALHTTFCEPEYFRVPISLCQERFDNCVPTGKYLPLNNLQRSYDEGTSSKNNNVFGYYSAKGHRVIVDNFEYIVSDNFTHWVVYNGCGDKGFLCIEPQCGEVNGLNGQCKILNPDESLEFKTVIRNAG